MARRPDGGSRAVALVTGASRRRGIGAAIALSLARAGWDVATTGWRAYDQRMPWRSDPTDAAWLRDQIEAIGARTVAVDADLTPVATPTQVFDAVETAVGPVTARPRPYRRCGQRHHDDDGRELRSALRGERARELAAGARVRPALPDTTGAGSPPMWSTR